MDQEPPLEPDEVLLRKYPLKPPWYDPNNPLSIPIEVFSPNSGDTDGISLFRKKLISAEKLASEGRKPPYGIVEIPLAVFKDLGLNVKAIQDEIPGHVVVPHINISDYEDRAKKQKIKVLQDGLARASRPPAPTTIPGTVSTTPVSDEGTAPSV